MKDTKDTVIDYLLTRVIDLDHCCIDLHNKLAGEAVESIESIKPIKTVSSDINIKDIDIKVTEANIGYHNIESIAKDVIEGKLYIRVHIK